MRMPSESTTKSVKACLRKASHTLEFGPAALPTACHLAACFHQNGLAALTIALVSCSLHSGCTWLVHFAST